MTSPGPNPGGTLPRTIPFATPGHWVSFNGVKIPDPPVGTWLYVPATDNSAGSPSPDKILPFPAARDAAVWAWMQKYSDDGSLTKNSPTRPDHATLRNMYLALITGQPHAANGIKPGTANPDPGAAQAGVGPLPNPLAFLDLLTNGELWIRVAEFAAGAILLGIGFHALTQSALHPSGTANAGKSASKLVGAVPIAKAGRAVLNSSSSKSFAAPSHHTRQYSRSGHTSHAPRK